MRAAISQSEYRANDDFILDLQLAQVLGSFSDILITYKYKLFCYRTRIPGGLSVIKEIAKRC